MWEEYRIGTIPFRFSLDLDFVSDTRAFDMAHNQIIIPFSLLTSMYPSQEGLVYSELHWISSWNSKLLDVWRHPGENCFKTICSFKTFVLYHSPQKTGKTNEI